jgi:uncharacterized cupredoxin-like copper-binding protein
MSTIRAVWRLNAAIGAAALMCLGVACGSSQATGPAATSAPPTPAAPTPYPSKLTVMGSEYVFKPSVIDLKVGQQITLTVVNAGKVPHDMKSDIPISGLVYTQSSNVPDEQVSNAAGGVYDVDFKTGTTAIVSFTPTKAGTYVFHCDQPGHTEAGMQGTFVVHE